MALIMQLSKLISVLIFCRKSSFYDQSSIKFFCDLIIRSRKWTFTLTTNPNTVKSEDFYPADRGFFKIWGFFPGDHGFLEISGFLSSELGIFIPGMEDFYTGYFGFLKSGDFYPRGQGNFENPGIFIPGIFAKSLRYLRNPRDWGFLGILYLWDFWGLGFYGNRDSFSWDGIHQKATSANN